MELHPAGIACSLIRESGFERHFESFRHSPVHHSGNPLRAQSGAESSPRLQCRGESDHTGHVKPDHSRVTAFKARGRHRPKSPWRESSNRKLPASRHKCSSRRMAGAEKHRASALRIRVVPFPLTLVTTIRGRTGTTRHSLHASRNESIALTTRAVRAARANDLASTLFRESFAALFGLSASLKPNLNPLQFFAGFSTAKPNSNR